jgi:putative MATE family efflux protein
MLLVILSAVLTTAFLLFGKNMLMLFGASENTIVYAMQYMQIYACGTFFVQISLGMNAFITAQGFAKISMVTVLIGAVANIILDPIMIFGLNMGVRGAAVATVISQALSAAWAIRFLTGPRAVVRLRPANMRLSARVILPCVALGLSPFIMQSTESILTVCFNSSLYRYGGDLQVGAMTILASVMQLSFLPLIGLTQGAQPIISYNYGARKAPRVKQAFFILLCSGMVYSTALWSIAMFAPQLYVKIFTNQADLTQAAVHAMRIYMAVALIFSVQVACQQTFIAIGNARTSLFLAVLRKIILLIPLIYILPAILPDKVQAVYLAEPIADFIAVVTTASLFFVQFRKALKDISAPAQLKGEPAPAALAQLQNPS